MTRRLSSPADGAIDSGCDRASAHLLVHVESGHDRGTLTGGVAAGGEAHITFNPWYIV